MEKLEKVIFYTLDKAIKTYRQFAQRRFTENGLDITIDQWLVLNAIADHPEISQLEIADQVFKDAASVTRIIDLLIKKNYLEREAHDQDRRRFKLQLTKEGKDLLKSLQKIVNQNRAIALEGIDDENLKLTRETLLNIIDNCQKSE
ncbi:MAG: MarR family transcriptional regulator [Flavisolibacter sp.]|nr:MarR family transcriptional regulator [Flavisolibacter sp.]